MKVFVGYDSREDIAYEVCRESMTKKSSKYLDIKPLKQDALRKEGLYWRDKDPLSSTEFTFTRFLTPYLAGYEGWALFCDCDFLFRHDVSEVLEFCDESKAVMVVKHDYQPKENSKMDGSVQTKYPRKNWSSFMLMNCGHEASRVLTPDLVNTESGMYLHQFKWLTDDLIGELPIAYNYLEGWYSQEDCPDPIAVHFTRGGPWFRDYIDVEYGKEWMLVARMIHGAW